VVKVPSSWSSNPLKNAPVVLYDAATLSYDDAATLFDAVDQSLADSGKLPQLWAGSEKNRTLWGANPDFPSGELYNPIGRTFDTIFAVYDGISGESPISTKAPAAWSAA
jgi:hypothetical protein